jgi:SEC-C motif-containing protein
VRIDGEWFYTDGGINPAGHGSATGSHKPGRNHPYPCGSGKKYKKCCGLAG